MADPPKKTVIWYKTTLREGTPCFSRSFGYKRSDPEPTDTFCCDAMEVAWKHHFIGFGDYEDETTYNAPTVNIYHCSAYPEGACWDSLAIHFCPVCGAPIEVKEYQKVRIKRTEETRLESVTHITDEEEVVK